jgi:Queuine tRNA-ribosyltransferase
MRWNQTLVGIDEDGATFRSYVDGTMIHLTPEMSIDIQRKLGADLIVVLDECTPFNVDKTYTAESMRRSHRWALRSLNEFARTHTGKQALYGIIQGGVYEDLRTESVDFINTHPFFGTAIGGSLGATKQDMHDIVAFTRNLIRDDRPVHLLGIGGIRDIFHGVRQGIDTFDCVHPTRLGRHGGKDLFPPLFFRKGFMEPVTFKLTYLPLRSTGRRGFAGALVMAAHWDEPNHTEDPETVMTLAGKRKAEKLREKGLARFESKRQAASKAGLPAPEMPADLLGPVIPIIPKGNRAMASRTIREHIIVDKVKLQHALILVRDIILVLSPYVGPLVLYLCVPSMRC